MHLSKPYWDGTALIINPVNPTAGFFGGDSVEVRLKVDSGASVVLTSPSATRIHQALAHQADMGLDQEITVAEGAWLDWRPEPTIPQAGSRFVQSTRIFLEPGAELFFLESLAPGRVASGERFAFDSWRASTQLHIGDALMAMERYRLARDDESLSALAEASPGGYFSSGFLVSGRVTEERALCQSVAGLEEEGVRPGASFVAPGVCVFKILAIDSLAHRRVLKALARVVYQVLERPPPALRKL